MYVRSLLVSVCLLLLLLLHASLAGADPALAIRPIDHSAAATRDRAMTGAALVRAMALELGDTDVIVHLQMSPRLPGNVGGTTRFVVSRGGVRYLRTTISTIIAPEARAAMVGHELQHALEIARSDAHDVDSLRDWWTVNGYRTGIDFYETTAALRVEQEVRKELRRSEAEPVVELDHQDLGAAGAEATAKIPER